MVKTKNYFLNPISRQNFANTFAVTHNLNLELCHMIQSNRVENASNASMPLHTTQGILGTVFAMSLNVQRILCLSAVK